MALRTKREVDDPLRAVRLDGGFWGRIVARTLDKTLPHALAQCEATGCMRNLDVAAGTDDAAFAGESSQESNLTKVMEGAAYALMVRSDPALAARLDGLIGKLAAIQQPDGYLQSYFVAKGLDGRYADLHRSHELYCFGHLLEAAVAHFEATGGRSFLEVAIRLADHVDATFGRGKVEAAPGHQEIELALVRLYRATGEGRYLQLARYFVDIRGDRGLVQRDYSGKPIIEDDRRPGRNRPPEYRQDHCPVLAQREATGHAVRAGYFYAAVTDIALECDSRPHAEAAAAIWEDIVGRKLYITGGVGTHQYRDEGFGDPYLLPNDTYCETCGSVALMLFSHRLGLLTGEARYVDVVELILFNLFLASTDLDGVNVFYRNPLRSDGSRRRHPWNAPACCPTNVVRIAPQIPRTLYTVADDALFVDHFASGAAAVTVNGVAVGLVQETDYPWSGRIVLTLRPERPVRFALQLRMPGWVEGRPVPSDLYTAAEAAGPAATLSVNGRPVDTAARSRGYCVVEREWRAGDCVTMVLPMPVRRVYGHEKIAATRGRVALMRGPLVYCLEEADVGDPEAVAVGPGLALSAAHEPGFLGGVTVLRQQGGPLTAIPYYAWNNRRPGRMAVWLREAVPDSH